MKRKDLIRHLEANGCALIREGSKHTITIRQRNAPALFHGIAK